MSSAANPVLAAPPEPPPPGAAAVRVTFAGFVLSGLLLSFLGAILPAWEAHLSADFTTVGKYFLALNLGIVLGIRPARALGSAFGSATTLISACAASSAAFVLLAFVPPPMPELWRLVALFATGLGCALLNTGLFQAARPIYERDRAATVNLAGALFGVGCLASALLIALALSAFGVFIVSILLALLPAAFAVLFYRARTPHVTTPRRSRSEAQKDLRTPLAFLLGLLLFFQVGNEWSIAGWLPVFLMRRLGSSPRASLLMLSAFWAALLAGRFVAQVVLPRVNHTRLLLGSALIELFGFLLLTATDNLFGASVGILLLAAGFALTYPLVIEKIGNRFPNYHPGFFSGIFTFAFTGALVSPWLLGYLAQAWGIRAVMILPLIGTIVVFVLLLLISLEAYLSASRKVSNS